MHAFLGRYEELLEKLQNGLTHLETFDSELAQSAQCLKELGEREVKSDDELKPLQTQLAANWERLKGVEGE